MAFWDKIGSRGDVEDRRGMASGLLGSNLSRGIISIGIVVVAGLFGINLDPAAVNQILGVVSETAPSGQQSSEYRGDDSYEVFASKVLGSTNDYWQSGFKNSNVNYQAPKLVLFHDSTRSGCGIATSQVGPHYCPVDSTIYLDERFFEELDSQLGGGKGDVAQAYVIAHEVGHHVQNLLGTMAKVQGSQAAGSTGRDSVSVGLELQADCYAGSWAHSIKTQGVFESESEINEALQAAAAVGDDRIQQKTEGQVNQETWTHGSAEQRVGAFNIGWQSGDFKACTQI